MYALEELYDAVLDLEQARREMPRPTDIEMSARWNADCQGKVEAIWSMLMVMEPLDVRLGDSFSRLSCVDFAIATLIRSSPS